VSLWITDVRSEHQLCNVIWLYSISLLREDAINCFLLIHEVLFSHLFTVIFHHIWISHEYWHKTVSNMLNISIHRTNLTFRRLWVTYYSLWYIHSNAYYVSISSRYSIHTPHMTVFCGLLFILLFDTINS
jgi:hypothetical protein